MVLYLKAEKPPKEKNLNNYTPADNPGKKAFSDNLEKNRHDIRRG